MLQIHEFLNLYESKSMEYFILKEVEKNQLLTKSTSVKRFTHRLETYLA